VHVQPPTTFRDDAHELAQSVIASAVNSRGGVATPSPSMMPCSGSSPIPSGRSQSSPSARGTSAVKRCTVSSSWPATCGCIHQRTRTVISPPAWRRSTGAYASDHVCPAPAASWTHVTPWRFSSRNHCRVPSRCCSGVGAGSRE
jgi:hypothetical protein